MIFYIARFLAWNNSGTSSTAKSFLKQTLNGCTLKIKAKRKDGRSKKFVAFFVKGEYFKAASPGGKETSCLISNRFLKRAR